MNKKMMLLALAVISAAAFALPAGASAAELHLTNVTKFTGTFSGGTLSAKEEPTITCDGPNHVEGTVSAGGTTGTLSLDYTNCRSFFSCQSGETAGTIKTGGTFHLITVETVTQFEGTVHKSPGILITPEHTTIKCSGFANPITVTGNVIGTVTSPVCNGKSKKMSISFNSNSGPTQEHKTYTGVSYNLTTQTGTTGTIKEGGLTSSATVESSTEGTLDCT
jgi:hypothetical protein